MAAIILISSLMASAQGNTFTRVRYNGGSVSTKVKPDDWDNKLAVSADAIVFTLKDGQALSIPPKQVTSLSYGQEAHRRVGTAIGLGILSLGVGALFALHKTKLHFIGINYTDNDAKKQGLLFQGDKSNFRAIIVALQGVTGAPVSVSEKERGEIPAGISVSATKEPDTATHSASTPDSSAVQAETKREVTESFAVTSNPDGAEIYVDDFLIGNTPTTLKLQPGKHKVRVSMTGYKDWVREITAQPGAEAHVIATLDKAN